MGDYLAHYGVKGMRWGVRHDRRVSAFKTKKDVDYIVKNMSQKDRTKFGLRKGEEYLSYRDGAIVVKRFIQKHGKEPVGFLDIQNAGYTNGKENVSFAIAISSDYQNKGYGTKLARQGVNFVNRNRSRYGTISWDALNTNSGSIALAKNSGFKYYMSRNGFSQYRLR